MVVYAIKQHKTNQKTHANQLISGNFCSFPAVITVAMSQYHLLALSRAHQERLQLGYCHGDRKSTRLNSSHPSRSRMPSSA